MFAFGFGNEFAEYFILNNIENTNCYSSSERITLLAAGILLLTKISSILTKVHTNFLVFRLKNTAIYQY